MNATPKAGDAIIDGTAYNQLLEDVRQNHDHSGNRNGAKVDHTNLVENGSPINKSHATLESDISTLQGKVPFQKIVYGTFKDGEQISGSGWSATRGDFNGSEGHRITITFNPVLPSTPILVATLWEGDYNVNGGGWLDAFSNVPLHINSVSTTQAILDLRREVEQSEPAISPIRFNFIAICP